MSLGQQTLFQVSGAKGLNTLQKKNGSHSEEYELNLKAKQLVFVFIEEVEDIKFTIHTLLK